jgi:hypothetical protein
MLIDHVGFAFFPDIVMLRVIGRLAFPMFAYQVATGLIHTRDTGRYFTRLFYFGLLSQIPYSLLFSTSRLNILFTFSFAVLLVYLFQKRTFLYTWILLPVIFVLLPVLDITYGFEYSLYGLSAVLGFYLLQSKYSSFIASILSTVFFTVITFVFITLFYSDYLGTVQVFSLYAAAFFFFAQEDIKLIKMKYFFYAFYPVHFLILWFVKCVI